MFPIIIILHVYTCLPVYSALSMNNFIPYSQLTQQGARWTLLSPSMQEETKAQDCYMIFQNNLASKWKTENKTQVLSLCAISQLTFRKKLHLGRDRAFLLFSPILPILLKHGKKTTTTTFIHITNARQITSESTSTPTTRPLQYTFILPALGQTQGVMCV